MADNNKTNLKDLNPKQKEDLIKRLTENLEVLRLHADIAEARAQIQKSNLEERIYTIKLEEFNSPAKPAKKNESKG